MNTTTHINAPGPRGLPLIGSLWDMLRNPLHSMTDTVERYGDISRMRIGPRRFNLYAYLLARPEHIKHVLVDNHRNYHKAQTYQALEPLLGRGLLLSEGDFWKKQRKLAQPAFHHKRLAAMTSAMVEVTEETAHAWKRSAERGETLAVGQEMRALTLAILLRSMFSQGIDKATTIRLDHALTILLQHAVTAALLPIPGLRKIPIPGNRRAARAVAELDAIVYGLIDARRGHEDDFDDLLSMLMSARDADTGEGMDPKQLRDEVMTFLVAGHETTAATLTFTWHLLGQHPHIEQRFHAELDAVLGDASPTFHNVRQLDLTTRILQEAMRLYPPRMDRGTQRTPG